MTLHLTISVVMPVGRDRKIRTALRNHQIAGFVSVSSRKIKIKINGFIIPLLFSVISVLILVCELHPMAVSVYRIGSIRCSFFLKSSLLKQSNYENNLNKKMKVWIVQGYVATYFWLVLKSNTMAYFGKMTQQWSDKGHYCSD